MVPLQFLPESTRILVVGSAELLAGFGLLTVALYVDHRKEMALIESGAYAEVRADARAWILGGGLLLLAVGLADIVRTLVQGGVPSEGFFAAFVGGAALVYYYLKRRENRRSAHRPTTPETRGADGSTSHDESGEENGDRDATDAVSP